MRHKFPNALLSTLPPPPSSPIAEHRPKSGKTLKPRTQGVRIGKCRQDRSNPASFHRRFKIWPVITAPLHDFTILRSHRAISCSHLKGSLRKIARTIRPGEFIPSCKQSINSRNPGKISVGNLRWSLPEEAGDAGAGLERANRGRRRVLMGEALSEAVHRSVKRGDHRHVVINTHGCPGIYARLRFVHFAPHQRTFSCRACATPLIRSLGSPPPFRRFYRRRRIIVQRGKLQE